MLAGLLGVALAVTGCGGGGSSSSSASSRPSGTGSETQTAKESERGYQLKLVTADFDPHQAVARPVVLELAVTNVTQETAPNVAVTLDSFNYRSNYLHLAARERPIWLIESGPGPVTTTPLSTEKVAIPGGAQTANVNTWSLGALAPGKTARFVWHVVPLEAGVHLLHFAITPSLGNAKGLQYAEFRAHIASAPPGTYVDPKTGEVVKGTSQSSK